MKQGSTNPDTHRLGCEARATKTSADVLPRFDYKVRLHFFPDPGLIVKAPTGVVYSNQCAGFMCAECEAEGFFVPLQARGGWRGLDVLQNLFGGHGFDEFTLKTADHFDRVLRRLGLDSVRSDFSGTRI